MGTLMFNATFEKRFWSYVVKTKNCWLWIGYKPGGKLYGSISKDSHGNMIKAHRASYILHIDSIPEGMNVCHTCDNPSCVRPEHLFLGSVLDNNRDCVRKNRHSIGIKNGSAKLTETQIREIKNKYIPKQYSTTKLSKEYGVTQPTIYNIVTNKTWRHIK